MTPDEPTIVDLETVHTAVAVEQNGAEWWVRIWCGEHGILLHPAEAALFAAQISAEVRLARARTKEAQP